MLTTTPSPRSSGRNLLSDQRGVTIIEMMVLSAAIGLGIWFGARRLTNHEIAALEITAAEVGAIGQASTVSGGSGGAGGGVTP